MGSTEGVVRIAGALFVAGAAVCFVGAVWPPTKQWYAPLEEGLRIIAEHPIGWRCIHGGFVIGNALTLFAFVAYALSLRSSEGALVAALAACSHGVAAVAWFGNLGMRLTITPWAAAELVKTGALPPGFAQWQSAMGFSFALYAGFAYLSLALAGWAALRAEVVPVWVGWGLVGWGLSGGLVVGANIPIMIYVPPLALLGAFLLRFAPSR
jgi:hypothetical protein